MALPLQQVSSAIKSTQGHSHFKAYGFHLLLSLFTLLQSSVNVSPLTVADKLKYIEDCQLTTDHYLSCLSDMLSKELRHINVSTNISNVS